MYPCWTLQIKYFFDNHYWIHSTVKKKVQAAVFLTAGKKYLFCQDSIFVAHWKLMNKLIIWNLSLNQNDLLFYLKFKYIYIYITFFDLSIHIKVFTLAGNSMVPNMVFYMRWFLDGGMGWQSNCRCGWSVTFGPDLLFTPPLTSILTYSLSIQIELLFYITSIMVLPFLSFSLCACVFVCLCVWEGDRELQLHYWKLNLCYFLLQHIILKENKPLPPT